MELLCCTCIDKRNLSDHRVYKTNKKNGPRAQTASMSVVYACQKTKFFNYKAIEQTLYKHEKYKFNSIIFHIQYDDLIVFLWCVCCTYPTMWFFLMMKQITRTPFPSQPTQIVKSEIPFQFNSCSILTRKNPSSQGNDSPKMICHPLSQMKSDV